MRTSPAGVQLPTIHTGMFLVEVLSSLVTKHRTSSARGPWLSSSTLSFLHGICAGAIGARGAVGGGTVTTVGLFRAAPT